MFRLKRAPPGAHKQDRRPANLPKRLSLSLPLLFIPHVGNNPILIRGIVHPVGILHILLVFLYFPGLVYQVILPLILDNAVSHSRLYGQKPPLVIDAAVINALNPCASVAFPMS